MSKKRSRGSKLPAKGSCTIQWVDGSQAADTMGGASAEKGKASQPNLRGPKAHKQTRRGRAPRVRLIG